MSASSEKQLECPVDEKGRSSTSGSQGEERGRGKLTGTSATTTN